MSMSWKARLDFDSALKPKGCGSGGQKGMLGAEARTVPGLEWLEAPWRSLLDGDPGEMTGAATVEENLLSV